MKKIIALSLVTGSLVATSAFGQGYLQDESSKSAVYDGFTTPGAAALDTKVDVALFWAAAGTTPTVDGISASTPTSSSTALPSAAWADILNGQFTEAFDSTALNGLVVTASTSKGIIEYNGGSSFGIQGTAAGSTYTLYEVSWNAAYATAQAASAAGSAVGWSAPIQFTLFGPTDPTITSPTFGAFGTLPTGVTPTPEPTTMALAGLGGLSLLAFRRKK
jgi:hypothetical protein